MKTPIRLLLAAAAAALLATPAMRAEASATTPAPPASRLQEKREARLQRLDEKLHLTAEQKARIQEVWTAAEARGKALRAEQAAARRELRGKRRELMRSTQQQVRAVLTPEQQKVFDELPRRHQRAASVDNDAEGR